MSDGEGTSGDGAVIVDDVNVEGVESRFPELSSEENGSSSSETRQSEKDPRKIARGYQLELCNKALEENIIVYLETGCGKTHIAVLLMYELGHLIRKPMTNICVFLAPTVALVHQQARVLEESTDFKVGTFSGNTKQLKNHSDWAKELEQYEVFVMTPQILLRSLHHCFIKMELIALLIFDECHHAQINSGHPYAQIMKLFYKADDNTKLPRIFGMTASPVVGKGASSGAHLPKCLNSLEKLLHAKLYSVEDKEELENVVSSPLFRIYEYGPVANTTSSAYSIYCNKLEEIKRQCLLAQRREINDFKTLQNFKKMLNRVHSNLIFCLEQLGVLGASHATKVMLTGNIDERNELIEAEGNSCNDSVFDKYLAQAAEVFDSDCTGDVVPNMSPGEVLKEPFLSVKLLRLIGILSTFRLQPNMKCIVFVSRIITARTLSYILNKLEVLAAWKCDFLVGVHSGLRNMSRRTMSSKLEKFRSGELNLLVATKVGEEGLDIQTCCLVIRFDLPETVASFIQSRGRARMPQSEYAFLVDRGNQKELDLIENFKENEDRMNVEINFRTSMETLISHEDKVYRVDSSGASISSSYSISLLHQYCAKLPHDEFFDPKPEFYYVDDGGIVCYIILPSNAPIHQLVSAPHPSKEAAKRDACLKAIEELHKRGALSDYLLPERDNAKKLEVLSLADTDGCQDEGSQRELHEMLIPETLRKLKTKSETPVLLNSYYINFNPIPKDRLYKEFGLFVKAPLPREAERMELELHLARGRSVMMNFVPSGSLEFDINEIILAENFQEMFLKVLLDRSHFSDDFVPLGKKNFCTSESSTFYLLLPVTFHDYQNTVTVDWKIVRRCLSSPVFRNLPDLKSEDLMSTDDSLFLVNGWTPRRDIVNSLVYIPCKNELFFVKDIICEKNGYSLLGDSSTSSHLNHCKETYSIHLRHPDQPLLQLKPLFSLRNLLHNRKSECSEPRELEEYFTELPPELCHLKIIGFSKNIGSSLSLLPSIMHRLEGLLVAIELKNVFCSSFPEGAEVTAHKVLEALTTEKCQERFSLERLEILGDAFLKFAVSRHLFLLHESLDEGGLTGKRSSLVNNSNLYKLAINRNLQAYIRDQNFDPRQFFAPGRPCPRICNKETKEIIHSLSESDNGNHANSSDIRCSKGHQWLQRKTVADVVEALVGAFLVDSGFKGAIAFLKWIGIQVDFKASQLEYVLMASTKYMPLSSHISITDLESSLGYKFHYRGLLLQAFIHPSYNKHGGGCYQRLEFLGDAVLDYLITSYVFSVFPKLKPGQLTDLRSVAVNNSSFADVAVKRSFHNFIICDSGALSEAINKFVEYETSTSEDSLLEPPKCPKALGDLVESCMGALLLDTGFNLNFIWKVMLSFLDPVTTFTSFQLNPLRELREICQSHNWGLDFLPSRSGGTFSVEAKVTGEDFNLTSAASNSNKKEAIRVAAKRMCLKLKDHNYILKSTSLEEVLKSTCRMEPKLIGYNEKPSIVTPPVLVGSGNTEVQDCEVPYRVRKANARSHIQPLTTRRAIPGISDNGECGTSESTSNSGASHNPKPAGVVHRKSARSLLYEICTANCWKPPAFECWKEEGQSHLKSFTFKVVVQIEDIEDVCIECIGNAQCSKKAAAEDAAKGVLWYLSKAGYIDENETASVM